MRFLRAASKALTSGMPRLLPMIFGLQMLTLYVMETAEQLAVRGHLLGAMVWLGGPAPISLAVHGAICVAVAFAIARSVRTLAATTIRVIRLIQALAAYAPGGAQIVRRGRTTVSLKRPAPICCRIGERAPPLVVA
jgi:hypothetical protein